MGNLINCPFCGELGVNAITTGGYKRVTHLSDKDSRSTEWVEERVRVIGDCKKCNKTKKEIDDYFKGKTKLHSTRERIERYKRLGMKMVIKG